MNVLTFIVLITILISIGYIGNNLIATKEIEAVYMPINKDKATLISASFRESFYKNK